MQELAAAAGLLAEPCANPDVSVPVVCAVPAGDRSTGTARGCGLSGLGAGCGIEGAAAACGGVFSGIGMGRDRNTAAVTAPHANATKTARAFQNKVVVL